MLTNVTRLKILPPLVSCWLDDRGRVHVFFFNKNKGELDNEMVGREGEGGKFVGDRLFAAQKG